MAESGGRLTARRSALLVLVVYGLQEVTAALVFSLADSVPFFARPWVIPLTTAFWFWGVPFLINFYFEQRGLTGLGIRVPRRHRWLYLGTGLLLIGGPALLVGVDAPLGLEFVDQIVYIGVPEEVFNRGYVQTRLAEWKGPRWGLLLSAILFGASHVVSRLAQQRFRLSTSALEIGAQAFLGGLVFGYVYRRFNSIVPGAILHVATNAYLSRIVSVVQA